MDYKDLTFFSSKDTQRLRVKILSVRDFHAIGKQKKAVQPDKTDLMPKMIKDKGHCIMIKVKTSGRYSSHKYKPHIGTLKFVKQVLTDQKGER